MGAAARRRRVERGLPKYTEADLLHRQRWNEQRRGDPVHIADAHRRADERIQLVNRIKMERGCADCGYRGHPAALDFDHLPGMTKVRTIARMRNLTPLETLVAEVAKCEVVCANCHRIRTVERRRIAKRPAGC